MLQVKQNISFPSWFFYVLCNYFNKEVGQIEKKKI